MATSRASQLFLKEPGTTFTYAATAATISWLLVQSSFLSASEATFRLSRSPFPAQGFHLQASLTRHTKAVTATTYLGMGRARTSKAVEQKALASPMQDRSAARPGLRSRGPHLMHVLCRPGRAGPNINSSSYTTQRPEHSRKTLLSHDIHTHTRQQAVDSTSCQDTERSRAAHTTVQTGTRRGGTLVPEAAQSKSRFVSTKGATSVQT